MAAAAGVSAEAAAKQLERAEDEGGVVGQLQFPVGQRCVKRAPKVCKLGVALSYQSLNMACCAVC